MSDVLDRAVEREHPGMLHAGDLLAGRYRLTQRIGAGGMARVFRARDELLDRDVAVKLFYSDDEGSADDAQRKASEARVLASLSHRCLVTLYDAQVDPTDHAFLVMELIDGPTLRQRIEAGPLDDGDVAAMLHDIADALSAVHRAGIVHRDVKPSNVLVRPSAAAAPLRAVLADFGVAHLVNTTRHTTPGTVIGTAAYLAPEQVHGEPPIPASDVYSLGLLVLEALTRLPPFVTHSLQATVLARLTRDPDMPADLHPRWRVLLEEMTARDPAHRPSAAEVADRARALGPTRLRPAAHGAALSAGVPSSRRSLRERAAAPPTEPLFVAAAPNAPAFSSTRLLSQPVPVASLLRDPGLSTGATRVRRGRQRRRRVTWIGGVAAASVALLAAALVATGGAVPAMAPGRETSENAAPAEGWEASDVTGGQSPIGHRTTPQIVPVSSADLDGTSGDDTAGAGSGGGQSATSVPQGTGGASGSGAPGSPAADAGKAPSLPSTSPGGGQNAAGEGPGSSHGNGTGNGAGPGNGAGTGNGRSNGGSAPGHAPTGAVAPQ